MTPDDVRPEQCDRAADPRAEREVMHANRRPPQETSASNPWLVGTVEDTSPDTGEQVVRRPPRFGRVNPGTVAPPERDELPLRTLDADSPIPAWWWIGCHGGAGVSTLASAFPQGADAGRSWPIPAPGAWGRAVLVTRSHASGLRRAQAAARQWASGAVPRTALLGLVVVADAPGKLPPLLRDLVTLVSGAVPRVWPVAWMDELRVNPHVSTIDRPTSLMRVGRDLAGIPRIAP